MFDAVLRQGTAVESRFGPGAVISFVIHAGLLALALYFSAHPLTNEEEGVEVKFLTAAPPPPPPPPPPPAPAKTEKKVEKKVVKKPDAIVQPKEIPEEKPPEAEPEAPEPAGEQEQEAPPSGAVEGGVIGGVEGGQVGGVLGGVVGGGTDVVPFGEGMTRPDWADARTKHPIAYSREAREAMVEGLMIVKCVVTVEGSLTNCRIIKPLPHMERAALDAMSQWRVSPVTYQGRPISVDYVFNIRLAMPR